MISRTLHPSRPALVLTALLLGCATAEPPKQVVDAVPMAEVAAALLRLREAGLELVQQRDEAVELADKYRKQAQECDAGRRT